MRSFGLDDSFHPSPRLAMHAAPEGLAYVALANPSRRDQPDAVGVIDLDPRSRACGTLVGQLDMPHAGDEIHHLGWNACSASLCPYAPHRNLERRYLIVPGTRSSRIHVIDTRPDPRSPRVVKVIEPETLARLTGYAHPRVTRPAPDNIYINALGTPEGTGPGGLFVLDPETFDVRGRWELDRGPQHLAGDFGWHLGRDTLITTEWGARGAVEGGLALGTFRAQEYGHRIHLWDRRRRAHVDTLDLGPEHQMVLAVRPAHDPTRAYGFVSAGASGRDLSASVWLCHQTGHGPTARWAIVKVIDIPPEPARGPLPEALRAFGVVPPLVTSLTLSLDDRFLYVSCWGTGTLCQYDVSNPFAPRLSGSVRLGGVDHGASGVNRNGGALDGGPHTSVLSRDGSRLYVTNSLDLDWDDQFYPAGIRGWLARVTVSPSGGLHLDERCVVNLDDWRPHDVRLEDGDASSDTFCYP